MKYRKWRKGMKIFLNCLYCLFTVVFVSVFIYRLGGWCDYREELGIEPGEIELWNYCANNILERFGEPLEIEITHYTLSGECDESDYSVYMKYPSFTFILSCTDENKDDPSTWMFFGTMITDPSIEFKNGVHIGMSRRQVIWTYRHSASCRDPGVKLGDSYLLYHGLYITEFLYDEHDRVTSIIFWG